MQQKDMLLKERGREGETERGGVVCYTRSFDFSG